MCVQELGPNHDCHARRAQQMGKVPNLPQARRLKSLISPTLKQSGSLERRIGHKMNPHKATKSDRSW